MIIFNELSFEERAKIRDLFATWLKPYTHEVINKVMERSQEIINNDTAMMLLRQLQEREKNSSKDFNINIGLLLEDFKSFSEFNPHNNPLQHPDSYRDILYDLYIRDKKERL